MPKIHTTENGTQYHIHASREQEIKQDRRGTTFVKWTRHKLPLINFEKTVHKDSAVPGLKNIHGIYSLSAFSCYAIELSEDGESARVYYVHW